MNIQIGLVGLKYVDMIQYSRINFSNKYDVSLKCKGENKWIGLGKIEISSQDEFNPYKTASLLEQMIVDFRGLKINYK